ncbi:MAG: iron-sulfur cluster assembly accessory protein [Thermaerobacterales bacterium]
MITVTEKAGLKIREVMNDRNKESDTALRLFIREGGCSGFSYGMAFERNPGENDQIIEAEGVQVVVDPVSAMYLKDIQLDYIENMMGGGFTIRNPGAVQTCGCGQSFRTASESGQAQPCDEE